MGRILGVVSTIFLSIFVSGCALPLSVTVASWALDGASYLTTQKSITDHGISFIAGQDCALFRVVTELDVSAACQKYNDPNSGTTVVVDASDIMEKRVAKNDVGEAIKIFDIAGVTRSSLVSQPSGLPNISIFNQVSGDAKVKKPDNEPSIAEIANFETASGADEPDLSDFEKMEDPAKRKGFNFRGIWNFLADLAG